MYPRIRDLREDRDKTQQDMAVIMKIGQTTYSRYETGELDIPSQTLIKLALYHETSIDYLVGLTDKKDAYERVKEAPVL